MALVKVLLGILIAVAGGHIGLRALLYISIAFAGGFAAVSCNKGFFSALSSKLSVFTAARNADIITFLVLTLVPLMLIVYLGRRLMVRLSILEDISPAIDHILGSAYALTVFLAVLAVT